MKKKKFKPDKTIPKTHVHAKSNSEIQVQCLYCTITGKTHRSTLIRKLWTWDSTSFCFSCRAALAEESSCSRTLRQASKPCVCSSHSAFLCATMMSICFISSCSSASQDVKNPPLEGKELEVAQQAPPNTGTASHTNKVGRTNWPAPRDHLRTCSALNSMHISLRRNVSNTTRSSSSLMQYLTSGMLVSLGPKFGNDHEECLWNPSENKRPTQFKLEELSSIQRSTAGTYKHSSHVSVLYII